MIDYTASKITWREYEERVHALTPVQDYALKDERRLSIFPILSGVVSEHRNRRGWLSKGVGQVLNGLGAALLAAGSHIDDGTPPAHLFHALVNWSHNPA